MAGTWEDEKIARLVSAGGKDGLALYGAYWRVLEIVASQMKPGSDQCSVSYTVTRWSVLLSVRGSHLSHYMGHLSNFGLLTAEWNDSEVRVTIPNLLKYRDEYSSKSGPSPKNVPSRTELDTEGEYIPPTPAPKPRGEEGSAWMVKAREIALAMHGRHPTHRRCSRQVVENKLSTICKTIPDGERIATLEYIDHQHALHCESIAWTKDGGEYCKGLEPFLNPKARLWENEPLLASKVNGFHDTYREG